MFYKPKFCCHCGDAIERVHWRLRDSRRFCDICETDHVIDDWSGVIACSLFIFSFFVFSPGEKIDRTFNPVGAPARSSGIMEIGNEKRQSLNPTSENNHDSLGPDLPSQSNEKKPPAKPKLDSFCGVITKKGTPCTRGVRKGERCWQHQDK